MSSKEFVKILIFIVMPTIVYLSLGLAVIVTYVSNILLVYVLAILLSLTIPIISMRFMLLLERKKILK